MDSEDERNVRWHNKIYLLYIYVHVSFISRSLASFGLTQETGLFQFAPLLYSHNAFHPSQFLIFFFFDPVFICSPPYYSIRSVHARLN